MQQSAARYYVGFINKQISQNDQTRSSESLKGPSVNLYALIKEKLLKNVTVAYGRDSYFCIFENRFLSKSFSP